MLKSYCGWLQDQFEVEIENLAKLRNPIPDE